jgi:hypothetical protein
MHMQQINYQTPSQTYSCTHFHLHCLQAPLTASASGSDATGGSNAVPNGAPTSREVVGRGYNLLMLFGAAVDRAVTQGHALLLAAGIASLQGAGVAARAGAVQLKQAQRRARISLKRSAAGQTVKRWKQRMGEIDKDMPEVGGLEGNEGGGDGQEGRQSSCGTHSASIASCRFAQRNAQGRGVRRQAAQMPAQALSLLLAGPLGQDAVGVGPPLRSALPTHRQYGQPLHPPPRPPRTRGHAGEGRAACGAVDVASLV